VRIKHLPAFLLVGFLLVLAGPHSGFTQQGGPPEGGMGMRMKGMKGKGKGNFDPNMIFNMLAKGKDVLDVGEMQAPAFGPDPREKMKEFLAAKGVANGQMTRDLYAEFFKGQMAEWQAKREARDAGGAPGAPGAPAMTGSEDEAREIFKKMDRDNSGTLSPDEVRGPLSGQFAKYDKDNNGVLDFDEFKEYWKDRAASRAGGGAIVWGQEAPVIEEKRPTVYRFGNLPKELPTWFEKLDRDKDGQVGLYEWKSEGKPTAEFLAFDQNGDGFLTVEEVLRFEKAKAKKEADAKAEAAGGTPTRTVAADPSGRGADFKGKDNPFGKRKGMGGMDGGKGKGKGKGRGMWSG
jgi:hypothetical protein